MSEFAEWIDDFEIPTTVKKVVKNGVTFEKPTYEDFSVSEIGFYVYGKNLNVKDIVKWFNKNMITVREQPKEVNSLANLARGAENSRESYPR
jgi:hypothetical protein